MASFPNLKTGVVAQYPSDRQRNFFTQVVRFVDGSEQRYAGFGAPLRRWVIRYELLDEGELESVAQFFDSQAGRAGTFSFTDPFDGTVYASCSFDADQLGLVFGGVQAGSASVTIRENRG